MRQALEAYGYLMDELVGKGSPKRRIMLAGFSRSACLTAGYAVRNTNRYGGTLLYGGGLIGPSGTCWEHGGSFGRLWSLGTSDVDEPVPQERVRESARGFERMGPEVDARVYLAGIDRIVSDETTAALKTPKARTEVTGRGTT